jgi:carboxyl-terminal processing protease
VLIDGKSASASEIVAGSLQDLDRAVILGERSFGKGLVQRYRNLTYGTKLKLTISKYYTPSGRNIQELDYTHRDGDDVPKFAKENRNAFKTKNGRTVYDGGGILPDIVIKKPALTESTKALFRSDAIFNFASDYFYRNQSLASPETFVFEDREYDQFISFLLEGNSNFQTKTEKKFEAAFDLSKEENLSKGIQSSYKNLAEQLEEQKIEELDKNKENIKEVLSDEIINRYYFKKGEYQNHIVFSPFIKEAISVLENDEQYRSILMNGKN